MAALVCSGCDYPIPADELLCFSCPNRSAGGDDDHILRLKLSPDEITSGWPKEHLSDNPSSDEVNPFLRFRQLSYGYLQAMRLGMDDSEYVAIVKTLSDAIAEVDRPLRITDRTYVESLECWVKNETVNVSGSHKARHLIGTAIDMEVASRLRESNESVDAPLAIASCGNAALAAAVVAKAAGRSLHVFVPPSADTAVVHKLESLGATRIVCEREENGPPGDPCYLRFRQAVDAGALPFSCQGGDNAHALLGGHSLGWELIDQQLTDKSAPDRVFIQVGGGALASSIIQAYRMAKAAGLIESLPHFHAVQTQNAHPLARAWQRAVDKGAALDVIRHQRSEYMWPWEEEPHSIAGGILDDETYDWFSIVEGLVESGGSVITVSEDRLGEAQKSGSSLSEIAVDATGSAGFAGLLEARASTNEPETSVDLVLFTGVIR